MFDKFGEFDSAEEINRAAAAQLKEGDLDAIKTIAEENGLDSEDAEDFCTGAIDSLTTPLLAAMGKLEMESKDLGLKNMMEDWKNFLIQMCEEDDQMAQAVRKKGKSLEKCMAQILKVSFETKAQLDDRIVRPHHDVHGRAPAKKMDQYGGWSDDHERCCIYKNRYTACNSERRKTNRIRD